MSEPPELDQTQRQTVHASAVALRPIGYVRSAAQRLEDTPIQSQRNPTDVGVVEIFDEFAEALDGLDEFDYAWLVSYLDEMAGSTRPLRVVPFLLHHTGERLGVFATRHPARPNPIGLSLVWLLAVDATTVHFAGLDLRHGTPVLDIKPWEQHLDIPGYRPGDERVDAIRGGWYQRTGATRSEQRLPPEEDPTVS